MKRRLVLLLFVLVCVGQWWLPGAAVVQHQRALRDGTVYRFRTAPVDPVDPFRGRYVALDFDAARIPNPGGVPDDNGRWLYVRIEVAADGFARLVSPSLSRPEDGDYLRVQARGSTDEGLIVELPFERYYLDERLAPEAERVYRQSSRQTDAEARPAYVTVRVLGGTAVLDELYLDGLPVRERLRASAVPAG